MASESSIVAIATPQAPAALGIVRCSGEICADLSQASRAKNSSPFQGAPLSPRQATLKKYFSKEKQLIDEVIVVFYKGKESFTGEDSLEMTCHGNPYILKKVLEDMVSRGFRVAEPGEFTRRAFINGKIDLTQAEAVGNLIGAHSDRALAAAHQQLAGDLGGAIRGFSDSLLALIAQVEATIDFPEEDVPPGLPPARSFEALYERLMALCSTRKAHDLTFQGAKIALVGAPNAGKSSLFNALLGHERALVSPEAGTTRDYLTASVNLGPHFVTFIDTAGFNPGVRKGSLEARGMEKTQEQLSMADLLIFVYDGTAGEPKVPANIIPLKSIFVANKSDCRGFLTVHKDSLPISATRGNGMEDLKKEILKRLDLMMPATDALMVSSRHALALDECLLQLSKAIGLLKKKSEPAIIAHHLRSALDCLGEILGKFDNEQVLDKLFSQFCIGK